MSYQHPQAGGEVEVDPLALHDLADLPSTASPSSEDVLPILRARFLEGILYIGLSSRALVAINPYQQSESTSREILAQWSAEYSDSGADGVRGRMGAHVWEMSGRAYYHMKRTGQDQTLLLSGETGSGKSESGRLLMKSLIDLSALPAGKKGSKLVTAIPAASFILDAFGSASTLANTNASRFGRYTELQFGENGRLIGLKGLEYYLEKSRVTGASTGERNFHIFYALVAGASPDEREHLHLDSSTSFRYLSHHRSNPTPNSPDAAKFLRVKEAFKAVGFPKKVVASICQLLAAILHLGNLDFHMDRHRNTEAASVKNTSTLELVADFLGVDPDALERALTNKSTLIGSEMCSVFLDPEAAATNRDDLARALYGLIFSWIGEFLNEKLCRDDFTTFISIIDFPGPIETSASHRDACGLDAFCFNLASERVHGFLLNDLFEKSKPEFKAEEVSVAGLDTNYRSNAECVRVLTNMPGGLVHIIDDQSRRRGKTDSTMLKAMAKRWGSNATFGIREGDPALARAGSFSCSHWNGQVDYSVENFLASNSSALAAHFVSLLGGSTPAVGSGGRTTPGARDQLSTGGSSLSFVRQLFSGDAISTTVHPKSEDTIVEANQKVGPRRAPSTRRPKGQQGRQATKPLGAEEAEEAPLEGGKSVVKDFNDSISLLLSTLAETKSWHVLCLRPNDAQLPNQVDPKLLKQQIRALAIPELASRLSNEWTANLEQKEFWDRYSGIAQLSESLPGLAPLMYRDKMLRVRDLFGWTERDMAVGKNKVFLSDFAFRQLEDILRCDEPEERQRAVEKAQAHANAASGPDEDPFSPYSVGVPQQTSTSDYNTAYGAQGQSSAALPLVNQMAEGELTPYDDQDYDRKTFLDEDPFDGYGSSTHRFDDDRSLAASGYAPSRPMFDPLNMPEKEVRGATAPQPVVEEVTNTPGRRRWVALTWAFTWWIPSFCLSSCGGMKRPDVRMAWREKLLINMLIWLLCGIAVFVIAILGRLICPTEYVFSSNELSARSYTSDVDNMLVAIRGEAFDLTTFAPHHDPGSAVIPLKTIQKYGGVDATSIFPVQVSALCNGVDGSVSPWVTLESSNASTSVSKYHDFRAGTTDYRADWYYETMVYLRYNYRKGFMGYTPKEIRSKASSGAVIAIYNGGVYDLTDYVQNSGGGVLVPDGQAPPSDLDRQFMSGDVVSLFQRRSGKDITNELNALNVGSDVLERQLVCLRNLFFIGKVDNRNSLQCQFAQYILLAVSILMVSIVGFKFLAALQFGRRRKPEDYDKFVICQVPCYTEGEESLRNCIDSLTKLKYDDKRKLLFMICDGNIVGSGNDRPTPRIVLDILGADPMIDPEPLSFQSIGNGLKQHNMAKIYSGLHEAAGHIVPYIVVVKCGLPTEQSRPGNRGKRDSQMLLMRFLNRVHFDAPMAPAELEMYHQIKNVIGVNPSFYEYLLMVDADTVVDPLSLNYLVGAFVQDKKLLGNCGETSLSNAKASWTTMMQVYEYWISQYLTKSFESLFGSVTCLPGCFSMYRIRSVDHKPLLIANNIIREYGTCRVDTLHFKNLLSLGEDRYLTTCMLKEFTDFKMKVCLEAKAQTIAPDDWRVLMSQRRRWINSTIHNLAELLFVDKLCGFCCFSMRFVVMVDLASTLIAPVTVGYIGYIIYLAAGEGKGVPMTAIIMLAAIYGLQALIYILHRKFEHIGWMIMYILAIPFFSFVLPLVSFWQMDDFSWGSTREIVGEKGKRVLVHEDGEFDPASIPLKTWEAFENELWEQGSNESIGELAARREDGGDSRYGGESVYFAAGARSEGAGTPSPRRSMAGGLDIQSQHGGNHSPYGHSPQPSMQTLALGGPFQDSASMYGFRSGPGSAVGSQYGGMGGGMHSGSQLGLPDFSNRPMSAMPTPQLGAPLGYLPQDDVIVADVHAILASADLDTTTKKTVRQQLEAIYGVELGDKKGLVNRAVESALGLA
ncbi:translation initiation factor IF-2 [Meredithblackwellia eburnea MCA 4105]